jgi:neutral ceramidase
MSKRLAVVGSLLFYFVILVVNTANAQTLKAGAAKTVITPPLGMDIIGGFSPAPSTHVHDDLHARCIVLDDGKTRLALAVCDLVGISELVCNEAKRQISERFSIPTSHVLISATHTHSASSALGRDRFQYDQSLDDYQKFVATRIADGVACAINNLKPAEMAFGTAEAPEHLFNRRWYLKPGTMPENPFGKTDDLVKMNPGAGNANLVEPAGPTDPTISFLAFREPGGRPIALFTAYSLHYVGGVGNGHISADYFAVYADEVARLLDAERLDPPFIGIMANGTSGDVNNINFRQPRPRQQPYEQIRYVASDVAKKVKAALDTAKYRSDVTLDARFREPTIKWRRPNEELVKWAKDRVAAGKKEQRGADLQFAYAQRTVRMADYPETTTVPLQALCIGEVCIGTMPVEVFTEIGLEFKQRAAQQPAFLVELANGSMGYLPTPRQHKLGGYETWLGTNRLEIEASDKMLDELVAMSKELKVEGK